MGKMKFYFLLPMIALLAFGSVSFAEDLDREALKAELRNELKAELKQELMAELKNETKSEVQAEVQEATGGLRDVLKADFREEIRSELMQETIHKRWSHDHQTILGGLFKGTTVTGFVDVGYSYNFRNHGEGRPGNNAHNNGVGGPWTASGGTGPNGPPVPPHGHPISLDTAIDTDGTDVGENDGPAINYVGENEDNSFVLENFAMFIDKECTDEHPIGWQMHTYWGEKAKRITFAGPDNDTIDDIKFAIAAANISWNAPVFGKHIKFTIGKMYTWIGYELVENIGNPNYTHGTVYNNAIPFTHTGISADVSEFLPSDKWSLTLYGVNGWDSYIDNNEGKSFGTYLTYQPNDDFFISLATIWGPEGWGVRGDDANGDNTMMYDIVATYSLPQVDKLSLGFNWDHGYVEDANGTRSSSSGAHWWAAVGYLMYDFTDNQQGAFRIEYFDDTDGAKGFDQSMWTATYTHNITIHDNLLLRPEIRYNHYNGGEDGEVPSGGSSDNTADDEVILTFGTEYVF